jgi:uncharacterized protein (UPF0332 family)
MPKDPGEALRGCFRPKQGKPNLRRIPPDPDRMRQHIDKAHGNLRAMKLMYDGEHFDWAIICGYYAMYHAVLAALYKLGIRAFAHYCAIAAFREFYIERGKVDRQYMDYIKRAKQLERKYAETLEKAQEIRVIEQYGVEVITNEEAEWIIEDAKDFVLKIEEVLAE